MGLFSKGDNVTVTSDSYPSTSKSHVGKTGEVTGVRDDNITVRLDGDAQSTGFFAEELTRNR